MINTLDAILGGLAGVRSRVLTLEEPFAQMAARFADEPGTVVLLSGGASDCARYHLLAVRPWLTLAVRSGQPTVTVDGTTHPMPMGSLDLLERVLARCRLTTGPAAGPLQAGLFGYLAYDLKDELEALPRTTVDDLGLPHLCFFAPSVIAVHDKNDATTRLYAPVRVEAGEAAAEAAIAAFLSNLKGPRPPAAPRGTPCRPARRPRSNFSRDAYVAAVERIREYIAAGDVYQVNLSQRFETDFEGEPYPLFQTLYDQNPAPFFAYVHAGDHRIVSTSPERFLWRRGNRVESRPIKGTRPRGKTPEADAALRASLSNSPKDDAELSMIVDLLRNDIGKVCAAGSVVVTQHKRLETYRNVHHLVSVIEGRLAGGAGSVDLIRAAFPGGSITGCPKIRAMEIIDELETCRRHIYTGSIGYIGFDDTLDLSIAIRTATFAAGRLVFSVGGGIVYDSDAADEYEETLHKGRSLMSVFSQPAPTVTTAEARGGWVWQDGRLLPQEAAGVSVSDLGLQYGFGCFETMRVEKGIVYRLSAHQARFHRTWRALFPAPPPDLTWEAIIDQVIEKNCLENTVAAVKLLATRGDPDRGGGTLLVTARPYRHRLAALKVEGLALATYPHPRQSPLADHKTLNYLYYHCAGQWALGQGAHEAIILNPDGTISETHSANILVLSGKELVCPLSPHVLPGVTQAAVCDILRGRGFVPVTRPVRRESLVDADMVLLTNALMGAIAALTVDGVPLRYSPALVEGLNGELFQPAA